MFTGIITDIGTVTQREQQGGDTHLRIQTTYDCATIALGASIACSGICLTVTETGADWFAATASAETAAITSVKHWHIGTRINLERALKIGDELGGHLVSGHIDGLATLERVELSGESHQITLSAPPALSRYIARKGSVTLDGVSLTVNKVDTHQFTVMIIPHTWQHTTLADRKTGDSLNLEVDQFARYMERYLESTHAPQ